MKTRSQHLVKMTYSNCDTSIVWAYPTKQLATKSMNEMSIKHPSIKTEYVGVKLK